MIRIIAWLFYIVGGLLVVGSYVRVVPLNIAWIGWGIGMVGWLIFQVSKPKARTAEDRLRELDELRSKGMVTEEEYARNRETILGGG